MRGATASRPGRDGGLQPRRSASLLIPVLGIFALSATVMSWGTLGYALQSLESVWEDRVEALAQLHETSAPFYRVLPQLSEFGHPVAMDSAANALTTARTESMRAWKLYLGTTLTEAEIALMNQTTGPVAELHQGAAELAQILRTGDHAEYAKRVSSVFLPRLSAVATRMEKLVALQQTVTRERVTDARRRHQWARALLFGTGAIATIVMVAGLVSRARRVGH